MKFPIGMKGKSEYLFMIVLTNEFSKKVAGANLRLCSKGKFSLCCFFRVPSSQLSTRCGQCGHHLSKGVFSRASLMQVGLLYIDQLKRLSYWVFSFILLNFLHLTL